MDSVPPASTQFELPAAISWYAERDGFHPRGARLVDGVGRNFLGNAAADWKSAARVGATAGLAGVAEDRFFDLIGTNAGSLHGCFRGHDAHVGGGQRR